MEKAEGINGLVVGRETLVDEVSCFNAETFDISADGGLAEWGVFSSAVEGFAIGCCAHWRKSLSVFVGTEVEWVFTYL